MAICKQCLEFFEPDDYEIAEDRQEDICPTCKYLTPAVATAVDEILEPIVVEPEQEDDDQDEEDDLIDPVDDEIDTEE